MANFVACPCSTSCDPSRSDSSFFQTERIPRVREVSVWGEREIQRRQCGDDGSLRAQDQAAERGFAKSVLGRNAEFFVGPAAFGADSQDCDGRSLALQNLSKRGSGCPLGKHHAQTIFPGSEGDFWFCQGVQHRHADAPGLLRGFQQNLFPALRALRRRCEQGFLAALRGERNDRGHSQLGGLFNRPFERVKLYYRQQQRQMDVRANGGQLLEQSELHAIAANTINPAEPHLFAVAQLIELTALGAQHASQVMRRFAFHDRGLARKLFHEKASSHAAILTQQEVSTRRCLLPCRRSRSCGPQAYCPSSRWRRAARSICAARA